MRSVGILAVFFVLIFIATEPDAAAAPVLSKAVVAYVFPQENALQPGQVDGRAVTRINYAFANVAKGRIVPGFKMDKENFAYLVGLKKDNPALTVLVSVGGWLWSDHFSEMALTGQSRAIFIDSVMEFLKTYDLDGLDIDWEYPGLPGSGHAYRKQDAHNFTLLLMELRARFKLEEGRTHRRLYLTIAAGAADEYLEHTEMAKAAGYVDTVNLMAYDMYEPSDDKRTGHHAPLYTSDADPKKVSADASVHAFERAGVPAEKILLGLPFYGHVWGQVSDKNHGLFQPGKPVKDAYAPYSLVTGTMIGQGFERYWDAVASVPYLYNSEKQMFVTYEDPESISAKCKYVLSQHLGGVMFWDYSSDPSGALLRAIDTAFEHPKKASGAKQ